MNLASAVGLMILSIPSALSAQTAPVITYYVASSGSDSNPGTAVWPFRTLQRGVDHAKAGDTIIVRDGTYGPETTGHNSHPVNINSAGTPVARIILKAEHRGAAILDCELTCHSYINFQRGAAYWTIQGFDIRNGYWAGIWANSGGARNILITGNHVHHIGNRVDSTQIGITGIFTDSAARNFVIDGNTINDIGRTNRYTNSFDHGIYSHGHLVIVNNVFYNALNGWHIQTAVGFSGVIVNNTFVGPNQYGTAGQIMLWGDNDSLVVRNNIFFNPKGYALTTFATTQRGCSIDNNIVFNSRGSVSLIASLPSGCTESNNRLNLDPLFVNPLTPPYDFHLRPESPAVKSAITVPSVTHDNDGTPRPQGLAYDVGAFAYRPLSPAVSPPSTLTLGAGHWPRSGLPRTDLCTYPFSPCHGF